MIDIDALKRDKRPQSAWVVHALIDRLKAAETAGKEADKACRDLTEKVIPNLRESLEAAERDVALKEKVIDALGSELNAVAKEREIDEQRIADLMAELNRVGHENEALRTKIAEMEQQEPVTWQTRTRPAWNDGTWGPWRKCSEEYAEDIKKTPLLHDWLYEARALYTLPGAQPAPNINEGVRKVTIGFRWESEAQHHIPTIKIEFDPVSPYSPNDAKGWQDRDRIASMLSPEAKP